MQPQLKSGFAWVMAEDRADAPHRVRPVGCGTYSSSACSPSSNHHLLMPSCGCSVSLKIMWCLNTHKELNCICFALKNWLFFSDDNLKAIVAFKPNNEILSLDHIRL